MELNTLLDKANKVYLDNFPNEVCFERAIFFSWGCNIGDCAYCYMSTQPKDKPLKMSRRSFASLFAETILAKNLGWNIGFISGGTGVFSDEEMGFMLKTISQIVGKVWLNIGSLSKEQITMFKPYIKGIVGSIETVNPELHDKVCPSKPIKPYEEMFQEAQKQNLSCAMTFIVGLGEKKEDFPLLEQFIKKYNITKIHVYGLNPQKGTPYENSSPPTKEDQAWWIANLRLNFPKLDIECGIWEDRLDYIPTLLRAGSNSISKFKATKLFGTKIAKEFERQAKLTGRKFNGTLITLQDIGWDKEIGILEVDEDMKSEIKIKLDQYLLNMNKNITKIK